MKNPFRSKARLKACDDWLNRVEPKWAHADEPDAVIDLSIDKPCSGCVPVNRAAIEFMLLPFEDQQVLTRWFYDAAWPDEVVAHVS